MEDALMAYQKSAEERTRKLVSRLKRLRFQQDVLKKKAFAILKEGYELDQLEEQEKLEEEQRRTEEKQARLASEINANTEAFAFFD
ncbi:hypothetical protein DL768_009390 [Monosporascus sp. mg162]|nr:hypothetical protein DL768_009390 [Monosporascus sp. mg162]